MKLFSPSLITITTNPIRTLTLTTTTRKLSMSTLLTPDFSSTYSPAKAQKDLSPLLKSNGGKWTLIESGKGIERGFRFRGFKRCWEFMNMIAPECTVQKHHPEWSNLYNTTFIRWTTHSPPGLSEKDIIMAKFCDEKARECGEVEVQEEGEEEGNGNVGRELVDKIEIEGGECCVPGKGKGK